MLRKIIHIDCDCFFAAVEIRDNPSLKGFPIAVGGKAKSRGVLSTCNYEARKFGLHSAMPTAQAVKLCPQVILLPHRFDAYKEASQQIHKIFSRYTDLIEPVSLDEAFLDVSQNDLYEGSASLLSQNICAEIEKEVGITASAGIAPNKFLAKVASDWNKPNGQYVIAPEKVADFMLDLPVEKIPGIGKKGKLKMDRLGIKTCKDLQTIDELCLLKNFGVFGCRLKQLSYGIDERPVCQSRLRKSLSVEHTFSQNIVLLQACQQPLSDLFQQLSQRLVKFREKQLLKNDSQPAQIKNLQLKVKFFDFTSTTIECQGRQLDLAVFQTLLESAWLRTGKAIRLLGIGVGFDYLPQQQLDLF